MRRNRGGYLMWAVKAEDEGVIYHPLFYKKEEAKQYVRASALEWKIIKVKLVEI